MAYTCEKSVGPSKNCDFRSGKIILQQTVGLEQMKKLLTTGSTDLLTDFISNKNRRKFSAFLVRDPSGKVVFKFQDKKPKAVAAPKTEVVADARPAKKAKPAAKKKSARTPTKRKTA